MSLSTPAQPEDRPVSPRDSVLPFRLVIACLFLNLLAAWLAPRPPQGMLIFGLTIGFFFGQTTFVAFCTVWLPVKPSVRLFAGAVAAAIVAISIGMHTRSARIEIRMVLAAAIICQWLVYQIPLWSMRLRGWQWRRVEELGEDSVSASDGRETQFGMQHIFIWTTIVALFTGIGKIIGQTTGFGTFDQYDLSVFANLVLGNSVLALPTIYAMFARKRMGVWLVGSIVWVALWTPILLIVIAKSIPLLNPQELWMFGLLDILQILVGTTLLYFLRRKGFRFVRANTGLKSSPGSPF